jgi:hypothetical protein
MALVITEKFGSMKTCGIKADSDMEDKGTSKVAQRQALLDFFWQSCAICKGGAWSR